MPGVKKSNPKKGHPKCGALRAAPSETVREGRAFRQGSCPGEKESASMPIPLRAFSSPSHSPHKGTPCAQCAHSWKNEERRAKSEEKKRMALRRCCSTGAKRQHDVRASRAALALKPGPRRARRTGEGKPEGWLARMPASFSPAQEVLSKNPVTRSRTRRARSPGCPFFGLLFLDSGHPCPAPFGPASLFAHAPACAWTSKEK